MKRIFLFLLTNILVMITISIVMSVFGLNQYLTPYGLDYRALAIFSLIWGMAGSFISLFMSKHMAKAAYGVQIIDPYTGNQTERLLYSMVEDISKKAGLKKMPEVGFYEADEVNAFATGWSKNHSLVAVSTGLVSHLDQNDIEAVLAHEISHIKNGDMVTLTLVQGVINAFAIFFARILASIVAGVLGQRNENNRPTFVQMILTMVFEVILTLLGSIVVFWFSRHREYRADAGGADLTSTAKMVGALETLGRLHNNPVVKDNMASMKITAGESLMFLFRTHPTLEDRIKSLKQRQKA